jgi:8-oxo-dGTP diphosphatase
MAFRIPEFGIAASGVEYVLRPGGYAVIFNGAGAVAVVSTPRGLFLPGGGQEIEESPEEAAVREAREECGLHISLGGRIGVADELVLAESEGTHYRKRCVFFFAEIVEELGVGEPDHELAWLAPDAAARELRHESQRWAVFKACRLITASGVSMETK